MHEQYEPTDIKILKFIHTWKNLRSFPNVNSGYSLNDRFEMIFKLFSLSFSILVEF